MYHVFNSFIIYVYGQRAAKGRAPRCGARLRARWGTPDSTGGNPQSNQYAKQPINQATMRPMNQITALPTNEPINQPTNQTRWGTRDSTGGTLPTPKPWTLDPGPHTLNPEPWPLHSKP